MQGAEDEVEGSVLTYVTETEFRKQRSRSPSCNSLFIYGKETGRQFAGGQRHRRGLGGDRVGGVVVEDLRSSVELPIFVLNFVWVL